MTGVNFIQNALYLAVYLIFVCLIGVLFYGVKHEKQKYTYKSSYKNTAKTLFLFIFLNTIKQNTYKTDKN